MEFDKGQSQYDGIAIAGYTVADLEGVLLDNYREATGAESTKEILHARSLLTRDGAVTNAGYLLFAAHPQQEFPEAYIRVCVAVLHFVNAFARLDTKHQERVRDTLGVNALDFLAGSPHRRGVWSIDACRSSLIRLTPWAFIPSTTPPWTPTTMAPPPRTRKQRRPARAPDR